MVQLTVDKKAIAKIDVYGGSVSGTLKSVDVNKNTVTLGFKTKAGLEEKTFELEKEGRSALPQALC